MENAENQMTPRVPAFFRIEIIHVNYDIMRSLGHEKIETTMIYLEKIFEKERHAIHSWKPDIFGEYI